MSDINLFLPVEVVAVNPFDAAVVRSLKLGDPEGDDIFSSYAIIEPSGRLREDIWHDIIIISRVVRFGWIIIEPIKVTEIKNFRSIINRSSVELLLS